MPEMTGSIAQMLFTVRYLHDRLLELGLCVRGAVTIGDMYWNEAWGNQPQTIHQPISCGVLYDHRDNHNNPITIGPGLIEAHELETECAVYPRILISRKVCEYVKRTNPSCFPIGPSNPAGRSLVDFFRKDADGWHFLDVLHPEITRNDTERIVRTAAQGGSFSIRWERNGNTHANIMEHVLNLVDEWLSRHDCPEKIAAKYEWLKSYAAIGRTREHQPASLQSAREKARVI
jgi:hypothetical protein